MGKERRRDISPRVQAVADELIDAYEELGKAQDPLVRNVLRKRVLDILERAVVVTLASRMMETITSRTIINDN